MVEVTGVCSECSSLTNQRALNVRIHVVYKIYGIPLSRPVSGKNQQEVQQRETGSPTKRNRRELWAGGKSSAASEIITGTLLRDRGWGWGGVLSKSRAF